MLRKGDGCTIDKQRAIDLFQKSAAQGNKFSLCSLGMLILMLFLNIELFVNCFI